GQPEGRLIVLGWDCAEPSVVFSNEMASHLRTLRRLMEEGTYARLKSIIPPITVPAWTCMVTGKTPGELGIYGFRNRKDFGYGDLVLPSSRDVGEETIWETLATHGKRSIIQGVPLTYPVKPLNGVLISGLMTPSTDVDYTYPSTLKAQLENRFGKYPIDVENFRDEDRAVLQKRIEQMTEHHTRVLMYLMKQYPWDFAMNVEIGLDRMHHGYWRYFDKTHRLYEPNNPYEAVIPNYLARLDRQLQEVLRYTDDQTAVVVVSDHGAQKMEGAFCINEWLIGMGYLKLKESGPIPPGTALRSEMVDWKATAAWAEGGYYSRIFINVKGREPEGTIPQAHYESFRNKLAEELQAVPDEAGNPLENVAYFPEKIYPKVKGVPPDLILLPGNLRWRAAGTIGWGTWYLYRNDRGVDDANHSSHGIYVEYVPWLKGRGEIKEISLTNLRQRWLEIMGIYEGVRVR
ncbi:MAG: alkaline phosphatase family protein, partial [bacterium JZ-2024 1]